MSTASIPAQRPFQSARRINRSLTAALESRALTWMAERAPAWLTSDQLTLLGLAAQIAAGLCYAFARFDRRALLLAVLCIALNWLGDSLDGTLARVRRRQRPRYGFYVDHMVDLFGALALLAGIACSGLIHWPIAAALLIAFFLLAAESYLATYTLSTFQLSQGFFGPTEIRILLVAGTVFLLRSPFCTIFGYKFFLFDFAGAIAAAAMLVLALAVTFRHTALLYREEPLP
ncbi:MAG: CDP-alcohol phosphatidyltransferase family protein [Acidobacteriaceae bacterium]